MSDQRYIDARYPLSALTGRINGAAQEVHRTLGPGFEEFTYQRALAKELAALGLEFAREVSNPAPHPAIPTTSPAPSGAAGRGRGQMDLQPAISRPNQRQQRRG